MDPESDDDWSEVFNERPVQSAQNHDCEAISDEWARVYHGGCESKPSRPAHSQSFETFDVGDASFDSQSQSREVGGSSQGILVCSGAASAASGSSSDPAPGVSSTADSAHETKTSKTRPFGSFGSAVLRQVMNSMTVDADPVTTPGTIEYARECKKTKIEERHKLQSRFLEFAPGRQSSTTVVPMDTMLFLQKYGVLSAFYFVGEGIHHSIVDCLRDCHSQGFMSCTDELVTYQLENSMTTISQKALSKQLNQEHIGDRTNSIASFLLLMSGYLGLVWFHCQCFDFQRPETKDVFALIFMG